ncbi:MAG: AraC family transcriptional regulator [Gammaproteobacteria bacterium]|nr:AraC family transcriptional regulator [Gammaproteobacteria bacterium]MDH5584715.1 AraC family transcriptional regulator [Gammaproteobacteria bacterium]
MQGFGDLVAKLGADPSAILGRAGLDPDVLSRSDEWVSFRSVVIAYETAALATNSGNFGIQLAGRRDLSFMGPMVLIFKYSKNLEQGLSSCIKYVRAHNTGYTPILEVGRETASWQIRMDERLRAHADQWIEESLLTAINLTRIFLGESYLPQAVYCKHAQIEGTDYQKSFGNAIEFRAPFDGIILNREDLKSPNPVDDQELYRFLLEYLDSRVLRAGEDLSAAVRSLLLKLIPTGKFSVNVLADQLGMHRRTLQRRLSDAGLSYAELLDDCRSRMARRYLLSSNLPMSNLAHMLGYSDQSAFNHAFRRWHGMTPHQWCEQPLEQQTKDPL